MARVPGIHHVTAVASDAQANLDFYTRFLGLRLLKRTVNFDVPDTYHLYYGDPEGRPGTVLTFFVWPGVGRARPGAGLVERVSLAVPRGSISYWTDRLEYGGIRHEGPAAGPDGLRVRFADPDGLPVELVARGGSAREEGDGAEGSGPGGSVPDANAVLGLHGATLRVRRPGPTGDLLTRLLGLAPRSREDGSAGEEADGAAAGEGEDGRTRYRAAGDGPGTNLTVLSDPEAPRGRAGVGAVHHLAWRAPDEETQARWRSELQEAGLEVTPVMDRHYFRSIYFREPGGVLFEIATDGRGFTVDEPADALGTDLRLPPWLEERRASIRESLPELSVSDGED